MAVLLQAAFPFQAVHGSSRRRGLPDDARPPAHGLRCAAGEWHAVRCEPGTVRDRPGPAVASTAFCREVLAWVRAQEPGRLST